MYAPPQVRTCVAILGIELYSSMILEYKKLPKINFHNFLHSKIF